MNSRNKGKKGELELAHVLTDYGYKCRRAQQFCGKGGESADITGIPYIHAECKRVEKLNIDEAMEQAKRDSKADNLPAVFHRKNGKKWKVTMELDDWIELYDEYYSSMKLKEREDVR